MKLKKEKFNVKIINKTKDKILFNEFQELIRTEVCDILEINFQQMNLKVVISDFDVATQTEETKGGCFTYGKKWKTLELPLKLLEQAKEMGDSLCICISIFHELAHAFDYENMLECLDKYFPKTNYLKKYSKTVEEELFFEGFLFWTEIYAYKHVYKNFKEVYHSPTLRQVIDLFEKVEKYYDKLIVEVKNISNDRKTCASNLFACLRDFNYYISKFMAGELFGKRRYYNYSKKTTQKDSYAYVTYYIDTLYRQIIKILQKPYTKGMKNKLINLGEVIFKNSYSLFNIDIVKRTFGVTRTLEVDLNDDT